MLLKDTSKPKILNSAATYLNKCNISHFARSPLNPKYNMLSSE